MASLQPSWLSSFKSLSSTKPSLLNPTTPNKTYPFKLSSSLNPPNDQSPEPAPQNSPGTVDPVKLAFEKAKAYKNLSKSNSNLGTEKNPVADSDGITNRIGEKGKGSETSKGVVAKVGNDIELGLEKGNGRNMGSGGVERKTEKKGELSVSSIDFVGLDFGDRKKSRQLPAGLVPVVDSFPERDLGEVEIIVGDTSKFGDTTALKSGQIQERDIDLYKPKVSTWGVFPRPGNISKTFGGGKTIRPGEVLETAEERAAKDARTRELLVAYKNKIGLNIDPKLKSECEEALKDGDMLMNGGKLSEAIPYYERVMEKLNFKSELHGLAALQWSICQDSLNRSNEARQMYERLQSHPTAKVSKKARQFVFSFQAMEMMKVTTSSPFSLSNTAYQNYFEAFIKDTSNYTFKGDEFDGGSLNQALPYILFLVSPIFLVLLVALQKRI